MCPEACFFYQVDEDHRGEPDGPAKLVKRSFGWRCTSVFFVSIIVIIFYSILLSGMPVIVDLKEKKKKGSLVLFVWFLLFSY